MPVAAPLISSPAVPIRSPLLMSGKSAPKRKPNARTPTMMFFVALLSPVCIASPPQRPRRAGRRAARRGARPCAPTPAGQARSLRPSRALPPTAAGEKPSASASSASAAAQ